MTDESEPESARLDLFLNTIEEKCGPPQYNRFCVAFMLDCSALIQRRIPDTASMALQIADGHRTGSAPLKSVSDAHHACWESLRIGDRDMRLDDPEVAAIRAAICILHRQLHPESDELVDTLSLFLRLLNNVEPHFTEQEQLIQKHFAECLPQ